MQRFTWFIELLLIFENKFQQMFKKPEVLQQEYLEIFVKIVAVNDLVVKKIIRDVEENAPRLLNYFENVVA